MRTIVLLLIVSLQLLRVNAQENDIRSAKITFEFPAKNVTGTIEGFQSTSKIDWDNPSSSVFKGSVQAETLDTGNGLRNWSLRGSKYFDVKGHPRLYFESTEINQDKDKWVVLGELKIKGTSRPFEIVFEKKGKRLIGKGALYCSDFGIKIKKKREDNLVRVTFDFELVG